MNSIMLGEEVRKREEDNCSIKEVDGFDYVFFQCLHSFCFLVSKERSKCNYYSCSSIGKVLIFFSLNFFQSKDLCLL